MICVNSLRSLRKRKGSKLVRRGKRLYLINKENPKYKARQP